METVTPRQLEILRIIRDFRNHNGFSPTMQEIGDLLNLTKVTVFEHVAALQKKDLLVRGQKHKARSLQVSTKFRFPEDNNPQQLPLVGRIVAGEPIEAVEDIEVLDLQEMFKTPSERFALRVVGDSMIDEHIRDGDFVVCERRNTAQNGDTVVALLADGEATLKTFYLEHGRVRLQPANTNYKPIYPDSVDIQGVVIGVIRQL